jgi:hypothetical protein
LTEIPRRIGIAVTVAVIAALAIGAFPVTTFPGIGFNTASAQQTTTTAAAVASATAPSPDSYSLLVQEPQLLVTPKNHTFTVPFDVMTRNDSLSLTSDQPDSYAWLYSNNTRWVFDGKSCGSTTSTITTNGTTTVTTVKKTFTGRITTTSITAASQVPCGNFPGEWWAVNGTKISDHVSISPSEVQMTIQPSSFPAHYSGTTNVTLNIQMPPGNYAVFLAIHVQEPDNPNFGRNLLYLLYYMPVVVSPPSTAQGGIPVTGSSSNPYYVYIVIIASAIAISATLLLYARRRTKSSATIGVRLRDGMTSEDS